MIQPPFPTKLQQAAEPKRADEDIIGCCGSKEHVTKPMPEPKKRAAQLKRLATLPEHLQLGVTRGLDATQFRFLGSLSFLAARVALLSLLPGPRSLDRLRERHGTARAVP